MVSSNNQDVQRLQKPLTTSVRRSDHYSIWPKAHKPFYMEEGDCLNNVEDKVKMRENLVLLKILGFSEG